MTDDAPKPPALSGADETTPERSLGKVDHSFYLIGVGASAGGLDAIKQLLSQVRPNFPHSLVLVQHISPDYKSLMSEILGRETTLPVKEVEDDMAIEPGHIYLIPPRSNIVIQGTKGDSRGDVGDGRAGKSHEGLRFSLIDPSPRPGLNLPIDVFLLSLAEAVEERGVAIILSGTGSDGSRGLRAVKDRDGFVMVQDPKTAGFDGMPRAAIATGIADLILSPDAMIPELNRFFEMRESGIMNVGSLFKGADAEFSEIIKMVSKKAEIDFGSYKLPTLQRRMARRMGLRGHSSSKSYLEFLKTDPSEVNVLYGEFLVGVTNFFRDYPVWETLNDLALHKLFEDGPADQPVRVWSVGCSTGEEAFSIAMLLERFREENDIERDFRIFASDVNEESIQAAKRGVYPESIRDEIPEVYLHNGYMSFLSGTFSVAQSIRNRVVFAVHNVMEDAPYTRTDLIVCRNLLIYLSPDVQAKVMTHFSFSLRKDGFLLLGAAETTGNHGGMFEPISARARIYRNTRRIESARSRGKMALEFPTPAIMPRNRRLSLRDAENASSGQLDLLNGVLKETNACICIVDETARILRTFGELGDLLTIPASGFSSNVLELVNEKLRSPIALILRRAELDGTAEKRDIRVTEGESTRIVNVQCRRITWESSPVAYCFTFTTNRIEGPADPPGRPQDHILKGDENLSASQSGYLTHLEAEVQSLQDMLSATAEDLGASNEELQTTNEELLAANEELQANNEETQSINEELHTVNAENAEKISELENATSDINNLLATADLGILLLNAELNIRRFSVGLTRYIELEQSDVGRPLDNFSTKLQSGGMALLLDDARLARDYGKESGRELRRKDGGWVYVRTRPFRSIRGERAGVVISILDVTELKILEYEVRNQRDRFEGILEAEAAGYWDRNIPEKTEYMSPRFKSMLGYEDHELENTPDSLRSVMHPDDVPMIDKSLQRHINSSGKEPFDNEIRYYHKDGSVVWVLTRGRIVEWGADRQPVRMMGVHIDITHLKHREEEVRRKAEGVRRFAFIAAHDLLQPMNTIEDSVNFLLEELPKAEDPDVRAVFGFLENATARMRARVGGILEYARLQDEKLEFEDIDLHEIAEECVEHLKVQIGEIGAEVTLEPLDKATGSPGLITTVFQNLLSNALKYRNLDRTCKIWIGPSSAPAGMVGVRITDNGIGIDDAFRTKVFELFARLHTDEEYEGSGLGLALSESIIQQHGGTINIADGNDGGSAFTFTLRSA